MRSLLGRSPQIAALISNLYVYVDSQDIHLSTILPSLSSLCNLIIGPEGHVFLNWRALPQAVKTAIKDLIKSPTLHTLHFTYILDLPISIIPLAAHVKVLKLGSVRFTERDVRHQVWDHANPMQVESIHWFDSMTNLIFPPLLAPHLRRCTIRGSFLGSYLAMQKMFAATKPEVSIQDLTWTECRGNTYIDLAALSHLRRLTFVTCTFNEFRFTMACFMWSSSTELLKCVSLRNLEEFSVTLRIDSERVLLSTSNDDAYFGTTSTWNALDALLGDSSQAPKLRAVNFCVEIVKGDASVSGDALAPQIGKRLPLLHHARKLSTMLRRGPVGPMCPFEFFSS